MRSLQRIAASHAPDTHGSLLTWGERALGHKIGYGVRPACSSSDRDEAAYVGSDPIPLPSLAQPDALPPRHRDAAQAARIAALRESLSLGLAKLERTHPGPPAHLAL